MTMRNGRAAETGIPCSGLVAWAMSSVNRA